MKIVLDAMGGDLGPGEVVRGAVLAAREDQTEIILVGDESTVRSELGRAEAPLAGIEVVHASEVVDMSDHPTVAVRGKKDASMVVGMRLVKEGRAEGFVSTGNSGAIMAAALFGLGRVSGIDRPAIATQFPTIDGRCLIVDVGANVEVKPGYLLQFGVMGASYHELVLGSSRPRVALLSNGEEDSKGTPTIVEAHALLKQSRLNFIGNIEGRDIPFGRADVIVTDGFTGNVVLKLAEGVGSFLKTMIRQEAKRDPLSMLGGLLMTPAFGRVGARVDYEEYGGAPLLGVEGVCIIAHGRSTARAVRSAIRVARQAAQGGLVERIRSGVATPA